MAGSSDDADLKAILWLTSKLQSLSERGGNIDEDWLGLTSLHKYVFASKYITISSNISRYRVLVPFLRLRANASVEPNDATTAQNAMDDLQNLKDATKHLDNLSKHVDKTVSSIESFVQPAIFHRGLASLPMEILMHIRLFLQEALDSWDTNLCKFSHHPCTAFPLVCRRFRQLELNTPALWAYVSDAMSPERLELHISRSGGHALDVNLFLGCYGKGVGDHQCRQWKILIPSSDRWRRLAVHVAYGVIFLYNRLNSYLRAFEGLSLSSLRCLSLTVLDRGVIPVFGTWSLPRLRRLYCSKINYFNALQLTYPLESLHLSAFSCSVNTEPLLDFLSSGKAAQILSLRVVLDDVDLDRLHVRVARGLHRGALVLPSVKNLALTVRKERTGTERTVPSFLELICVPNVETVFVQFYDETSETAFFVQWLPSLVTPSLRNIKLRVMQCEQQPMMRDLLLGVLDSAQPNAGIGRPDYSIEFF